MPPLVTRGNTNTPAALSPRTLFSGLMVLKLRRVSDTRVSICVSVAANEAALDVKATIARPVVARTILISISNLYALVNKECGRAGSRAIAEKRSGEHSQVQPSRNHTLT